MVYLEPSYKYNVDDVVIRTGIVYVYYLRLFVVNMVVKEKAVLRVLIIHELPVTKGRLLVK